MHAGPWNQLCEVPVAALAPDHLAELLGRQRRSELLRAAEQAREQLNGSTVWQVNSTAEGGGVAEMLRALLPWVRGAGIDTR